MEGLRDKDGGFKVLLVEDATLFRQLLQKTLHAQFPSIEIYQAGNVEEALQKVEVFLPDLIFMDIRLPDGNGLDLSKRIKSLYPKTIVIILTGYDLPEYEGSRQYADYFFSKDSLNTENTLKLVQSILTTTG